MAKISIYDIAREAGVSVATVSRVINKHGNVKTDTREAIEKLLAKYNYIPNALARGLSMNKTRTVGILTIDVRDPYFAQVIYTIEQELSLAGFSVLLCNTGGTIDNQRNYVTQLLEKHVDFVIFVGSVFKRAEISGVITEVAKRCPVILLNAEYTGENIYSVLSDEISGVYEATLYLVQHQHSRIGYIDVGKTYSATRKRQGFDRCMAEHGNEKLWPIWSCQRNEADVRRVVGKILTSRQSSSYGKDFPTAIVCGEDFAALILVQELTAQGLSVPEDCAVIGYNNSDLSALSTPPLSSVDSKVEEMGITGARICLDLSTGKEIPGQYLIKPSLFLRASC